MKDPIVTEELIQSLGFKGGITKQGAAYIGLRFPLKKGWKKRVIGKPRVSCGVVRRRTKSGHPVRKDIPNMSDSDLSIEYQRLIDIAVCPHRFAGSPHALKLAAKIRFEMLRRQ